MHASLKDALTSSDPREAVPAIVSALCQAKPGSEEAQRVREVEAARKRMMTRLDMLESDWPDAAAWASEHQGKLMSTSGLDVDQKKPWTALTPIEQFVTISRADDSSHYVTDAFGTKLTEVGRFAYILDCLRVRRGAVEWAICQGDFDALDRKKLAAELRASAGSTGYERMALRMDLAELDVKLRAHAATVKEALAKEPGYQAVFAAATAGRAAWAKTDPKLHALVTAMDDARITNSRRAYAGCIDKTWPALSAAIATIPAKKLAPVDDQGVRHERAAGAIANDPNAYLAGLAYVQCAMGGEGSGMLVRLLADAMNRWPGFRGPRTTALTTIMNAGIELDDRDARLEFPRVSNNWLSSGGTSYKTSGRGKVGKVEKQGDTAVVSFSPKMETFTYCATRKESNKIVQILSNGTLIYESWCTSYKQATENRASKPQTVDARYLAGVKPGAVVEIIDEVVLYVWPDGKATVPSHVAGVEVK
ncbi:MAG: hypothetical protein M4D80_09870 [Myxococcota bacterium]|nr:hypothetical protein [Deltaproteobacteria bacterium]MDQ3335461.1 hypothetical protein [Myxococcota bacterium]